MKVLMLGWELPPHHTGGMGIVCAELCRELAHNKVDIEFILPYTADFPDIDYMQVNPATPDTFEHAGHQVGIYDSGAYKTSSNHKVEHDNPIHARYTDYVTKLVQLGAYDIIHVHDWLTFRAGLAAKQITGKPLIAHVHATEHDRAAGTYGNPLVREIEYAGFQFADKIIAVSEATKQTIIREYGISPSKIQVVHNALSSELATDVADTTIYPYLTAMKEQGYKIVLSAGRLTIQKGLTHLMRAAKDVIAHQPKTLFVFVGGGEQYNELVSMSAELGIAKNVIIVGYLNGTGRAWRDSFRIADLFVMPSVSEPFGLTPLEALQYGTPVLISKQSGVSEVLHNCLKVNFWDERKIADQIIAVLRSEGLASTLLNNAQAEASGHKWSRSIERILDVYTKAKLEAAT
jgi:glycogen synthase